MGEVSSGDTESKTGFSEKGESRKGSFKTSEPLTTSGECNWGDDSAETGFMEKVAARNVPSNTGSELGIFKTLFGAACFRKITNVIKKSAK